MKHSILIIEDDQLLLDYMEEHLTLNDYEVKPFLSPVKGCKFLEKESVDLVITDVKMNEMTGDEVLAHVQKDHPETGVIMMTGFGNVNHAVRALQKGAYDYVTKPFKGKEILYRVNRYFDDDFDVKKSKKTTPQEKKKTPKASDSPNVKRLDSKGDLQFIGSHQKIQDLLKSLPQIARYNAPVMIQGESGTGKEVFAHLIHKNSKRSAGPYVKINCANLPKELVESTLFGHVKGAFTGAIEDRKGAFDEADKGTLLLDEITEIELSVQAKLLRVLQEKTFNRVGSQKPVKADVRIIATSNRDIGETIADGDFREDLYYRLNVFPISIPPLRRRKEDIPLLVEHFVQEFTDQYELNEKRVSDELMEDLIRDPWRGNVRELKNKIHRGVILSMDREVITSEDIEQKMFLDLNTKLSEEVLSDMPLMSIKDMELQLIKKALEHTQGNQKEAAEILGVSARTIRNKLKDASPEG